MRVFGWITATLAAVLLLAMIVLPGVIDERTMGMVEHEPYAISERAQALHQSLIVADLHTDSLLWHRDIGQRSAVGHSDLPRMQAGNIAIQVLGAVTQVPMNQSYAASANIGDVVTLAAVLNRWPLRTWGSIRERALYQAEELHAVASAHPDDLSVLRNRGDLEALLAARKLRAAGSRPVGTILAMEGAQTLEGDLESLQVLWDAGYRMLGLHHFFDNELGGSLHGQSRGGLTAFGRSAVRTADAQGWMIDVVHSSPAAVADVLRLVQHGVVVSHTGIRGHCDSPRNIDDALMKRIAGAGGLIGIGFWEAASCDITPEGVVRSIRYAIDMLGVEHVALGSDWDGATTVTFDASEIAVLTQAMLDQGFRESEIRAVMGGNILAFMSARLPAH